MDRRASGRRSHQKLLRHDGGEGLAYAKLARHDLADGGDDLFGGLAFHDVPARTRADRALGVQRLVMHREHEDEYFGLLKLEILDQIKAGNIFEREIDDGDIGLQFGDGFQGVRGRPRPRRRPPDPAVD